MAAAIPIADPADPRVAVFRDLRDPRPREREGLFAVEGRMLVRRLLARSRYRARALLLTPAALAALEAGDGPGAEAPARIPPGVAVHVAEHAVIRAIVGYAFHRGAIALAERGAPLSLAAVADPAGPRWLLALEDLADPENVGGAFRNAAAFGVDAVLVSAATADPLNRKAIRVSAGGSLALPFVRVEDWAAALDALRGRGYALVALTPDADAVEIGALAARTLPARVVLLVGHEGAGLGAASRRAADLRVRIPMVPGVDSLNVATATGIALHRLRPLP